MPAGSAAPERERAAAAAALRTCSGASGAHDDALWHDALLHRTRAFCSAAAAAAAVHGAAAAAAAATTGAPCAEPVPRCASPCVFFLLCPRLACHNGHQRSLRLLLRPITMIRRCLLSVSVMFPVMSILGMMPQSSFHFSRRFAGMLPRQCQLCNMLACTCLAVLGDLGRS